MTCAYCEGDVGEKLKYLDGKVSCPACRVVAKYSGKMKVSDDPPFQVPVDADFLALAPLLS